VGLLWSSQGLSGCGMPRCCLCSASSPSSRAFRSPLVPWAPSSGELDSLGEWRMPAMLGTQTRPAAVMADMAWASCPALLEMEREASPRRRAAAATTVGEHGDPGEWSHSRRVVFETWRYTACAKHTTPCFHGCKSSWFSPHLRLQTTIKHGKSTRPGWKATEAAESAEGHDQSRARRVPGGGGP